MRQVGLGLIQFLNTKNSFPNAGTVKENPATTSATAGVDLTKSVIYEIVNGTATAPSSYMGANHTAVAGTSYQGSYHSWVVDILQYIDQQALYNAYNRNQTYYSPTTVSGQPSNFLISNTHIAALVCPEDDSIQPQKGNLSFVVNGGFSRWSGYGTTAPSSWVGTNVDGTSAPGSGLPWAYTVDRKAGVMEMGTSDGIYPWDHKTTTSGLVDGSGTTLLLAENVFAGYDNGNAYNNSKFVTWAAPHPNFMMFIGSDNAITATPNWSLANSSSTNESINFGITAGLTIEGSFPYASSRHSSGVNVVMCDGSTRFITDTIDGDVWSKLLTPAGSQLPCPNGVGTAGCYRQLPLNEDAII
jgi:prepilin-type processing-associated H-X9-DG protein